MHLTLFGSAILLWRALLFDLEVCPGSGLIASFLTGIQMSVLGALLTFSSRPWFSAHAATTMPWGFTPLEDQQLGGLLMWVPGGILLTVYAVIVFGVHLHRLELQHHPAALRAQPRSHPPA
jgi:putative membrane protein